MLSDRWPTNVPACVSHKLPLRLEPIDVDVPPAFVLRLQDRLDVLNTQLRREQPGLQRSPEVSDDGVPPHVHQRVFIETQPWNPAALRLPQAASRDQNVEMRIKIQTSAKGVRYHHNQYANTILSFHPFFYHRSSESTHVVEEVAVLLKDWPENVWHRKDNACVWDVREGGPLFPLPQLRSSMPTARTSSRLAGVVNEFLLGL